ncbi:hypothetical protein IWW48_000539 [Coemansia sp. RSA 1200]|nr:hypothetical protein IWW48_000539 [Coemansia sp. RSA 1200]
MAMFLSRKAKSNNGNGSSGAARNDLRRGMNELSCMACAPQNSFRFTDSQAMDVAMVLAEEYVRTADPWPTKPTGLPIEPTSPDATPEARASGFPPPSPSWMQSPRAAATLGLRTISEELADADCDAMPLSAMIPPFPRPPRGNAVAPASLTSPAATLRVPSGQQCPPETIPADARGFLSLPMRSTRTRMRARVPTAGTASTAAAAAAAVSTTSRIVSSNSTVYGSDSFPAHGEKASDNTAFLKRRSRFSLRVKPVHSDNNENSPSSASKNPVRWIRQLFA